MATQEAPSLDLVREGLIALDIPADDITPDVSIRDDLDVDSTELVELAVSLGQRCGAKVDAKSIKDVDTPADLVRRLEELGGQAPSLHHTEHETTIDAPVDVVYDVLADVEGYARLFPPTQAAELLEESDGVQIARLTVDVSGQVQSWVTRRDLDPERKVIAYRQLETAPLVAHMGGEWRASGADANRTRLVITHDFAGRTEEADAKLSAAVERNSHDDLAAVKAEAERRCAG